MGRHLLLRTLAAASVLLGLLPASMATASARSARTPDAPTMHPHDFHAGGAHGGSPFVSRRSLKAGGSALVAGTVRVPVILADFADLPAERDLHTAHEFAGMLFGRGYEAGAGSLRDYFLDQSGGVFDVTGTVSPWVRVPGSHADYAGASYGYQNSETNSRTLFRRAVEAADEYVDFCGSDADGDAIVDSVFLVHAGPGAEETGHGLWSIQWKLPTPLPTDDVCDGEPVKVQSFTLQPEEYANAGYSAPGAPARMISIGMFVHEFGHTLGLPDLYDVDGTSPGGVGPYDVMASGAWGFSGGDPWRPTPLSAWSKLSLGWARATSVTTNLDKVAIGSVDLPQDRVDEVYRVAPGGATGAGEYFLVENRTRSGWASGFVGEGLAIWHVDERARRTDNRDNADDSQRLLELVQADGDDDLGRAGSYGRGDAGDLFPGVGPLRMINGTTIPGSGLHFGIDSGITIANISNPGPTTFADIYVNGAPEVRDEDSGGGGGRPDAESGRPAALAVLAGRVKAGDVTSLGSDDGDVVHIAARRGKRRYRVDYRFDFYPGAAAENAGRLNVELLSQRKGRGKLRVYDHSVSAWMSFGSVRMVAGEITAVAVDNPSRFADGEGVVNIRVTHRSASRFAHVYDLVALTFD